MFTLSSGQCHCVHKCNTIGLSLLCIAPLCQMLNLASGQLCQKSNLASDVELVRKKKNGFHIHTKCGMHYFDDYSPIDRGSFRPRV